MNTKQVIVIRKDLNMRTGKIAAQASHASMAFLTKGMRASYTHDYSTTLGVFETRHYNTEQAEEITHWLENSFRKICVYVNSEEELHELHQKALDNGLISYLIEDNGATEFNGVKTFTALAIGPHFCHKFEDLTDHLPLL